METILLRGFWPPRPEAADSCGDRLVTWVEAIGHIQPLYSTWYRLGYKPGPRYLLDAAGLRHWLARGRNRYDTDHTVIEDLGYSIGAHNAVRRNDAGIHVGCGAYSQWVGNHAVLNGPSVEQDDFVRDWLPLAYALVEATVQSRQPDWAQFTTGRLTDEFEYGRTGPEVGVVTYLSTRWSLKASGRPGVSVTRAADGGTMIDLTAVPPGSWPEAAKERTKRIKRARGPSLVRRLISR